jgi:hypothetical protein
MKLGKRGGSDWLGGGGTDWGDLGVGGEKDIVEIWGSEGL